MANPFAQVLLQRSRILIAVLASEARGAAFDASLTAVAALLGLAAVGCGIAALWAALDPVIGMSGAALASAVLLLLVAQATLWVRNLLAHRRKLLAPATLQTNPDLAEAALQIFSANKMALLLGALAAGAAAAAETQRRK